MSFEHWETKSSSRLHGSCSLIIGDETRWACSDACLLCSGWRFGTFFIFPYIGNNHPNWLIFFRGIQTTNQMLVWTFFGPNAGGFGIWCDTIQIHSGWVWFDVLLMTAQLGCVHYSKWPSKEPTQRLAGLRQEQDLTTFPYTFPIAVTTTSPSSPCRSRNSFCT